ncbi:MAG: hypothetical protein PHR61_04020 [Candidatus Absconditabacteria bacterium]|nr:hypothetical protein [Candidatus Absconditabacteria bacterium]
MTEEILKKIDKNNSNNKIDLQEIQDFSRTDENIQAIKKTLQQQEKSDLLSSLENSLNDAIDKILSQAEILESDIQILDLWDKLLGESDLDKKNKIKEIIDIPENFSKILDMVSKDFSKNTKIIYYNIWKNSKQQININTINSYIKGLIQRFGHFNEKSKDFQLTENEKDNLLVNSFGQLINGSADEIKEINKTLDILIWQRNIKTYYENITKESQVLSEKTQKISTEIVGKNEELNKINIEINKLLIDNPSYGQKILLLGADASAARRGTISTYGYKEVDEKSKRIETNIRKLFEKRDLLKSEIIQLQNEFQKVYTLDLISNKQKYYTDLYKINLNQNKTKSEIKNFLIEIYYDLGSDNLPKEIKDAINKYFQEPQTEKKYTNFQKIINKDYNIVLENYYKNYNGEKLKDNNQANREISEIIKNDPDIKFIEDISKEMFPLLSEFNELQSICGEGNLTKEASDRLKNAAIKINKSRSDILSIHNKVIEQYEQIFPKLVKYNAIIERIEPVDERLKSTINNIGTVFTQFANINKVVDGIKQRLESGDFDPDSFKKWFIKDGLVIMSSIAFAVGAIVVIGATGGLGSGVVALGVSAMAGSLGGMIGNEVGAIASTQLGKSVYGEEFDNSTMLGRYFSSEEIFNPETGKYEKIEGLDVLKQYGKNFAIGAATTFVLMGTGKVVGGYLNKLATTGKDLNKLEKIVVNITSKFPKMNPHTINLAEKKGINQFLKKYFQELGEESIEEAMENSMERIHPVLGYAASIYNCLDGGKVNYEVKNKTGINLQVTQNSQNTLVNGNKVISAFDYNSSLDQKQVLESLQKTYSELEYDIKIDGGVVIVSKKVSYTTKKGINIERENVMVFSPSTKPESIRIFSQDNGDILNQLYGFEFKGDHAIIKNTEPGNGKMSFEKYLKHNGFLIIKNTNNEIQVRKGNDSFSFIVDNNSETTQENLNSNPEIESTSTQIEQDQNIFDDTNIDQNLDTNTESDLNIFDKVQLKIGTILLGLHGKTELEIISDAGKYVVDNIKHFLHECKMIFGHQLVDLYKSYVQMKNNLGKPGDKEFQKLFQDKAKSWGINLTKLVGVAAISKLGIDPNLFFWSGHLIADQLQKNITFFDKLFHLSFETMNDLYGRKEGKNLKYNPKTVIENSVLTEQDRKEAIAKHLGLEINSQNEQLLNALLDAHKIGQSEIGKNPEYSAGVYNYTQAQIRQKMEILKPFIENGSIKSEQVRDLFALGYLGSQPIKRLSIYEKLYEKEAQLPIINNKHEYGLYDKNGAETNRDSFSIEQQKKITIQAFKQSIVEDLDILGNINHVNKTGYAFSQDTKVPGDIDYAIENHPQKIQQMITKLKQLESEGKIKNLKFTHKIRQEEIISESEIQEKINTKELRITYDGLTTVGDNKVSINREMFIEDGKGIFEINLNEDYIEEVDIDGKKIRFLTSEGYIPYAEDLLVTDLEKEFGETAKKLKVAKRIDDYIDALSAQENIGKKTTVFEKIINFIIGKQISKTKTQRMIESLKESDRYKNPNHVLHKQYVDAVTHLQKVVVFKIENIKNQQKYNKSSLEQKGEIISESRNIKERIKKYKSDGSQESIEQLKQDKIALEQKLLQQDLSIDENFYLLNEYYLLTQTEEYRLNNISIDPKIVKANATLSTEARIAKAKELIGDITPAQEQAILEAHNQDGTIYNLNFSQIRARVDILSKVGFTSEQIRILLENGICGQTELNLPLHFYKITNIDENSNINNMLYNKNNKPIQNFDINQYSIEFLKNNPDI